MEAVPYNDLAMHFDAKLPPLLLRHLPQGPLSLADLGCGDGPYFRALCLGGFIDARRPVWAVDLDPTRLGRVRTRFGFIRTVVASVETESTIPAASLDAVVSTMVMEHVIDERHYLEEMRRVLKPGGVAYVTTICKRAWAWYFRKRDGETVLDPSHVREYTDVATLRSLAIANGHFQLVALVTSQLWFPLLDPLLFRVLAERTLPQALVRLLRIPQVPVPGYRKVEMVLT